MKYWRLLVFLLALSGLAQQRLTLHWLVREDIFAGILANDRVRLEKGAQTLDRVAAWYPETQVAAWRAGVEAMRAVWAYEENRIEDFRRHYALTLTYFDRCRATASDPTSNRNIAIPEIFEGGVYVAIADRLPESLRAGAWERAYQSYKRLNELEAPALDKLPLHMKGEVLSGLAMATQRTGRADELSAALAAVREKVPNSVYSRAADKWLADPASATKVRIACLTCHEPNTLGPKLDSLHKVSR